MSDPAARDSAARRRVFAVLAVAFVIACVGFIALGAWQLQRMEWKGALIARVESRIDAAPAPIPPRDAWPALTAESDEYRRVRISGRFLPGAEVRTQAVTELGGGSWVLSAMRLQDGTVVFVNRGFVPQGAEPASAPSGYATVTGLLRVSEPGGGFLRRNDAAAGRWYSRDVSAIGRALGLPEAATAPLFVDADASASAQPWPRAGMTVVRFRDHHLQYALTWFGLAVLTAWAGLKLWRIELARRAAAADLQESNA